LNAVIWFQIVSVIPRTHLVKNHESQSRTNESQLKNHVSQSRTNEAQLKNHVSQSRTNESQFQKENESEIENAWAFM